MTTSWAPRERLFGFVNGQTGSSNANAQGFQHLGLDGHIGQDASAGNGPLIKALRNGGDLLNVFGDFPTLSDPRHADAYSPLWDAQLGLWTKKAISVGRRQHQLRGDRPHRPAADRRPAAQRAGLAVPSALTQDPPIGRDA